MWRETDKNTTYQKAEQRSLHGTLDIEHFETLPIEGELSAKIEEPVLGLIFDVPHSSSMTLGRSPEADFCIANDPTLSRIHCRFEASGSAIYLCNLSKTNGTRVNGQRVDRTQLLSDRDIVSAGTLSLIIRINRDRTKEG
ncbi:MAG TPA: hypothetical protein DDW52_23450 [Planctomycetaceae bacterium]|nr:hypothetical protein [Planctomycetaceae bacterium]